MKNDNPIFHVNYLINILNYYKNLNIGDYDVDIHFCLFSSGN